MTSNTKVLKFLGQTTHVGRVTTPQYVMQHGLHETSAIQTAIQTAIFNPFVGHGQNHVSRVLGGHFGQMVIFHSVAGQPDRNLRVLCCKNFVSEGNPSFFHCLGSRRNERAAITGQHPSGRAETLKTVMLQVKIERGQNPQNKSAMQRAVPNHVLVNTPCAEISEHRKKHWQCCHLQCCSFFSQTKDTILSEFLRTFRTPSAISEFFPWALLPQTKLRKEKGT